MSDTLRTPQKTTTQIEIRRAVPDDLPAIQDFIRKTYGSSALFKGPDRWYWQFVDTPFRPAGDQGPTVWIALSDGAVVGQTAVQDGVAVIEGKQVPSGWIVDVMVDPDFRGHGLGHRINDAIMLDRAVLVTLTMAPATRRIAERAGCITLGPTRQFILPTRLGMRTVRRYLTYKAHDRPDRALALRLFAASGLGPALTATVAQGIARFRRLTAPSGPGRDVEITEIDRFPDSYDMFWQKTAEHFSATFERSARFLNWRFCDCPDLIYRRFLLTSGGAIRGYLITRLGTLNELPIGVIADVFTRPDDHSALDALIAYAYDVLGPQAEYLEAAASTPSFEASLRRAGFIATRTMRPTVVCTDPATKAHMSRHLDDWHFTKADHDWDQIHPA